MARGAGFVVVIHDANNHDNEARKQRRENFEGANDEGLEAEEGGSSGVCGSHYGRSHQGQHRCC